MCSLFIRSKQQVETNFDKTIVNIISFHRCLANDNFVLWFDNTCSYLLQMMFYQKKLADLGHFCKILREKVKLKVTF